MWQVGEVVTHRIEHADEVAQCVLDASPLGRVLVNFFGQRIDLQIGQAIFASQALEHANAGVVRSVVHHDELVVGRTGSQRRTCRLQNRLQRQRLIADDDDQRNEKGAALS